jgi:hypothetical protein
VLNFIYPLGKDRKVGERERGLKGFKRKEKVRQKKRKGRGNREGEVEGGRNGRRHRQIGGE